MRRGRAHTNLFSGSNLLPVAELKYGGILFTRKLEQKSGAKAENEMEKKKKKLRGEYKGGKTSTAVFPSFY